MTASTLGSHPGRAVYQRSGNEIIQAPLIKNSQIAEMIQSHSEKLALSGFNRSLIGGQRVPSTTKKVQFK